MILAILSALSLASVATAAISALFNLKGESQIQGWATAGAGTLGLVLALLGHSTRTLDLTTVLGVLLFGGIAGAGWNPKGKKYLLAAGAGALFLGVVPRLLVTLALGGGVAFAGLSLPWAVARAAGFVAFACATGAVLLGAKRSVRLPIGGLPARLHSLHRALGVAAILALAVHLFALWADSFVSFGWAQLLLVPWTSSYRPFAVTLGFLAMVSLILTAASGLLRKHIPGWKIVHFLSWATFALGLIHGIFAGSDTGSPLALAFYFAALVAVGITWLRRSREPEANKAKRAKEAAQVRHPVNGLVSRARPKVAAALAEEPARSKTVSSEVGER